METRPRSQSWYTPGPSSSTPGIECKPSGKRSFSLLGATMPTLVKQNLGELHEAETYAHAKVTKNRWVHSSSPSALGGNNPEVASWRPLSQSARQWVLFGSSVFSKILLSATMWTHLNTAEATRVISPSLCYCHSCKTPGPGKEHLIGKPGKHARTWAARGRDKEEFHSGSGILQPPPWLLTTQR